jgi:hypothetical protein
MTMWKPHALARPHADQLDLRYGRLRFARSIELHGIPEIGTSAAKVILANGSHWQRLPRPVHLRLSSSAISTVATASPLRQDGFKRLEKA